MFASKLSDPFVFPTFFPQGKERVGNYFPVFVFKEYNGGGGRFEVAGKEGE